MSNAAIIAPRLEVSAALGSLVLAAVFFSPPLEHFAQAAPIKAAPAKGAAAKHAAKSVKHAKVALPRLTRAASGSNSAIAAARNVPSALNWRADPRARLVANYNGRPSVPGELPTSGVIVAARPAGTASRPANAAPRFAANTVPQHREEQSVSGTRAPVVPAAVTTPQTVRSTTSPSVAPIAASVRPNMALASRGLTTARGLATTAAEPAVSTTVPAPTASKVAPQISPTQIASLPQSEQAVKPVAPQSKSATTARPDADRILLAKLEADLNQANRKLDSAQAALDEGQESLNKFTNSLRQAMMEAGPDAKGLHPFVRTAERYAGTPYVWGGESARGFDCSGFIIRVMRDLGYKALPHSAAEQFRYGTPIAQSLLKPGDLVFFKNTYKPGISHVGIYLGRRRFIHAAGTGTGTIVSSLDQAKFQAKYAGARRLIAAR